MTKKALDIAVLSDIHYINHALYKSSETFRYTEMGLELLKRALFYIRNNLSVDFVVLTGDLVDNGGAELVQKDLEEIKDVMDKSGLRYFVVPGNHDPHAKTVEQIFGIPYGAHDVGDALVYLFGDTWDKNNVCVRSEEDMEAFRLAAQGVTKPIIVFQHDVVYPDIQSGYPYNLHNAVRVRDEYTQANVLLSVSGHFHAGVKLQSYNGVNYVTCPVLCEKPFKFLHISIDGESVTSKEFSLVSEALSALEDIHVHTEFASCSENMDVDAVVERKELFGLGGIAFTEHSGQLYVDNESYWSGRVFWEPSLIHETRDKGTDRMAVYRQRVEGVRSETVKVGLEVDCAFDGSPLLLDEDMEGWDLLIGAVHWLPCSPGDSTQNVIRAFMDIHEKFLQSGIVAVLAHPFRVFRRAKVEPPRQLFKPLAQLLAVTGVAVEVNFHTNSPDKEFFKMCLDNGVKIALGSDAHNLYEVGNFLTHIDFLNDIGATSKDLFSSTDRFAVFDR